MGIGCVEELGVGVSGWVGRTFPKDGQVSYAFSFWSDDYVGPVLTFFILWDRSRTMKTLKSLRFTQYLKTSVLTV